MFKKDKAVTVQLASHYARDVTYLGTIAKERPTIWKQGELTHLQYIKGNSKCEASADFEPIIITHCAGLDIWI